MSTIPLPQLDLPSGTPYNQSTFLFSPIPMSDIKLFRILQNTASK
jgi:hypothetical protein